jgi:hypothetical protein
MNTKLKSLNCNGNIYLNKNLIRIKFNTKVCTHQDKFTQ